MKKGLLLLLVPATVFAQSSFEGVGNAAANVITSVEPVVLTVASAAIGVFAVIAGYRILRRVLS